MLQKKIINLGLIGKRLDYSFSKTFFEEMFQKKGIDGTFTNFELNSIEDVTPLLKSDLSGLTVTIPYKETIIPFLDELSEEAKTIGAVNVVEFSGTKRIGHNSDTYGFRQAIKPFLTNRHERAIVIGTGGASKAIEFVLKSIGIDVFKISRNPLHKNEFGYNEMNEHMVRSCKLVVNCTPVGTFPNINDVVPFPFDALTEEHLVVDLIYNPAKTKFLEEAEKRGSTILNGESMLKEQALKAWDIWTKE